jgi:hypothetical protein
MSEQEKRWSTPVTVYGEPGRGEFRYREFETDYGWGFSCQECGYTTKGNLSGRMLLVELDNHLAACPGPWGGRMKNELHFYDSPRAAVDAGAVCWNCHTPALCRKARENKKRTKRLCASGARGGAGAQLHDAGVNVRVVSPVAIHRLRGVDHRAALFLLGGYGLG